ncbi:MAG: DUF222 domain-containing protein, partial [Streptosporangiaceae bacterium]
MSDVVTPPATARQAAAMLDLAMSYLASANAAQMTVGTQAHCLQKLERAEAMGTAARASILGAFATSQGHLHDADHSPRAWLVNKTRITKGAAAGHMGWVRRVIAHPQVAAELAAGRISQSFARAICQWNDKLPDECRAAADAILLAAALAGADLEDLARLAAEIYTRSVPDSDDDPGQTFDDRGIRLETTFEGAGVIGGDLTPQCAAVVRTVLDALSAPRDADDDRTHAQRYHDALEEAMSRLVTAGMVPERAGQPSKVVAHISLHDLIEMDSSALVTQWAARLRARWAGYRAATSVVTGDGGVWLDGEDAQAFACDASVTPIVFGEIDPAGLDDLVRLCLEYAGHGPACHGPEDPASPEPPSDAEPPADGEEPSVPASPSTAEPPSAPCGSSAAHYPAGPFPATDRGREALAMAIIGKAVGLVSGPGGLASFLRRHKFDGKLAGPSLPLDVGVSRDIPAAIRAAVIARDQHCQWPGGCDQPACASQVHHVTHQAHGGKTSVEDCKLYCFFH